jgi:hypothetical protein
MFRSGDFPIYIIAALIKNELLVDRRVMTEERLEQIDHMFRVL